MLVEIRAVDGASHFIQNMASNEATRLALRRSTLVWLGMIDHEPICLWGLIAPSIMSDQAYLWLHVTDAFEGNEFVFVRHSQLVMEKMLTDFPVIIGHVEVGNLKAFRWLRWLGAVFQEPQDRKVPFSIRRQGWTLEHLHSRQQ